VDLTSQKNVRFILYFFNKIELRKNHRMQVPLLYKTSYLPSLVIEMLASVFDPLGLWLRDIAGSDAAA